MKRFEIAVATLVAVAIPTQGIPLLADFGAPYTQDFNTLTASGTGLVLPDGWFLSDSGSSANINYTVGTGSSTTGDTYSFGSTASSERALGMLQSGSLVPMFGVQLRNGTGQSIGALAVSYWGEQWRLGALNRADRLDFQYSLDAGSLTTGTWTDGDALDFSSPKTGPSTGALIGDDAVNRTWESATIGGFSLAPDSTIWFRWTDFNASGSDDGLAVDDFSVQAAAVSETLSSWFAIPVLVGVLMLRRRFSVQGSQC